MSIYTTIEFCNRAKLYLNSEKDNYMKICLRNHCLMNAETQKKDTSFCF